MAGLMLVYRQQKLKRHRLDVVDSGIAQSLRFVLSEPSQKYCLLDLLLGSRIAKLRIPWNFKAF